MEGQNSQTDWGGLSREWVSEFRKANGRAPRVLHISNIANNAYINAKIQRRAGIDADVLSHDYYHVMGTPEWEDGSVVGELADPNFPDWSSVKVKGFKRPRWFVSGAYDASIRYLLARRSGAPVSSFFLWQWLKIERWLLCGRGPRREKAFKWIEDKTGRQVHYAGGPANAILLPLFADKLDRMAARLPGFLSKPVLRRTRKMRRAARTADICNDVSRHDRIMFRHQNNVLSHIYNANTAAGQPGHFDDLKTHYKFYVHPYLRLLFSKYDVIQAYSIWTMIPFLVEWPDYIAYEHGTLRDAPWQEGDAGKICLAAFKHARHVCLTNTDVVPSARRMGLTEEQLIRLPHAYDDIKLKAFRSKLSADEKTLRSVTTFIAPARQDWEIKGSDRMFRALRIVKDHGNHCVLRVAAWGADLDRSKALVEELGVSDMVEFIPTMGKSALWKEFVKAHAVVDQFKIGAMGGISFETMGCGSALISRADYAELGDYFGEAPPMIDVETPEQIAAAFESFIETPGLAEEVGAAGLAWMNRYHSSERIVGMQCDAYRATLNNVPRQNQRPEPQGVDEANSDPAPADPAMSRWEVVMNEDVLGVPCMAISPNKHYSQPYQADRQSMVVRFKQTSYLAEEVNTFYLKNEPSPGEAFLLRPALPLDDGEALTILDNPFYDLAVGVPMVRVERQKDETEGFITLDTLISRTVADESGVWVAEDNAALRSVVEFDHPKGKLYSTNRMDEPEIADSLEYMARFSAKDFDHTATDLHPLTIGAHAHRLGVWALDRDRDPEMQKRVSGYLSDMVRNYALPHGTEVQPGAIGWHYPFDFQMPWGNLLPKPWFSGYANASIVGAIACAYAFDPDPAFRDLALAGVEFLKTPLEKGGAFYTVYGHEFVAEYVYKHPPIPNYRVLDGEISSVPYLTNAGILLDAPEISSFAARLAAGLHVGLRMLKREDGAPLFGMDGQDMTTGYMWQLWMNLQVLAAIHKDRTFADYAKQWKPFMPDTFREEGYQL